MVRSRYTFKESEPASSFRLKIIAERPGSSIPVRKQVQTQQRQRRHSSFTHPQPLKLSAEETTGAPAATAIASQATSPPPVAAAPVSKPSKPVILRPWESQWLDEGASQTTAEAEKSKPATPATGETKGTADEEEVDTSKLSLKERMARLSAAGGGGGVGNASPIASPGTPGTRGSLQERMARLSQNGGVGIPIPGVMPSPANKSTQDDMTSRTSMEHVSHSRGTLFELV